MIAGSRKEITFAMVEYVHPVTGELSHPVVRRVSHRDGKHEFVSQERIIAASLTDFRRHISRTAPVEGAPTQDEVRRLVGEMSADELESLGLARAVEGETIDAMKVFASQEARDLALKHNLNMDDLSELAGSGSGRGGRLTAGDLRELLEADNTPE